MAAVVFPQEAVVEYIKDLLVIADDTARDASTLARNAAALMDEKLHGRVIGRLRSYARRRRESVGDEILKIVADMETFLDPKIVEHKKRIEAGREAAAEEEREKEEAEDKASWEPGGSSFNHAVDQLVADAHWLIYVVKIVRDSDDERLVHAMSDWVFSEERGRLFKGLLEALKPPPEASPSPAKRRSRRRPNGQHDKVVHLFNDT